MASEHQRPLAAYFLLCIAVAFLLTQGVLSGTTTTLDRVVSRAGQPAALLFQSTTLTVLDTVGLVPEREALTPVATSPVTATPSTSVTPPRVPVRQPAAAGNGRAPQTSQAPQSHGGPKAQHPGKSKQADLHSARTASVTTHAGGKGHGKRR